MFILTEIERFYYALTEKTKSNEIELLSDEQTKRKEIESYNLYQLCTQFFCPDSPASKGGGNMIEKDISMDCLQLGIFLCVARYCMDVAFITFHLDYVIYTVLKSGKILFLVMFKYIFYSKQPSRSEMNISTCIFISLLSFRYAELQLKEKKILNLNFSNLSWYLSIMFMLISLTFASLQTLGNENITQTKKAASPLIVMSYTLISAVCCATFVNSTLYTFWKT
eukprot:UN29673